MLSIVSAEAKKCLSDCKASPEVWRKVIECVLRKEDTRSLLMLVTSRFTKRCDLGSLDYKPLTPHAPMSRSSMSDFEKSVMGILDRNGSHKFLKTCDMDPLHLSMLFSKFSGERWSLFQYSFIFLILLYLLTLVELFCHRMDIQSDVCVRLYFPCLSDA